MIDYYLIFCFFQPGSPRVKKMISLEPLRDILLGSILSVQLLSEVAMAQQCLQPANPQGIIPFGDVSRGDREDTLQRLLRGHQVIVTSYQFQCCGTITRWQTYVRPNGDNYADGQYNIRFQVWRPSNPEVDDGCYDLAGVDNYENILFPTIRGLVNRRVPQPSQLTVQPGDVVGFFVWALDENDGTLIDGSIQFNENTEMGFTEEQAWYNEDFLMIGRDTCPFPVGPNRVLSGSIRAAPVLSLDIDQIPCEVTLPTASQLSTTALQNTTQFQLTPTHTEEISRTDETSRATDLSVTTAGTVGNAMMVTYGTVGVVGTLVLLLFLVIITILIWICWKRIQKVTRVDIPIPTTALEVHNDFEEAVIPLEVNECYSTNMPMKVNESYSTTSADIPLEVNECYATTALSGDPLHAKILDNLATEDCYDYI